MTRTAVVTGAGSGVGRATASILASRGVRVIGVDLTDTEVVADLSTSEGRSAMARDVALATAGEPIDALVACAGVLLADPLTVRVNYFGVVEGATALLPLLAGGTDASVAVVSSVAGYSDLAVPAIVEACLAGDEAGAVSAAADTVAAGMGDRVYASSKQALSRWVRRVAASPPWAGAGVKLNGVGPGIVQTPMVSRLLGSDRQREWMDRDVPMPLSGHATADQIAEVLVWLVSPENSIVTGQIVYADGGADASVRGDRVW